MNATLKTRAAREFTVTVNVKQAATTLTTAVYSNLALLRVTVDRDLFQELWTSAYTLILRIIQGKPCTGTVPLPIFQLLASFRARVVDLKNGQVLALKTQPHLGETAEYVPNPPSDALNTGVSTFCHYASQLMGALVDLKEIDRDYLDSIPEKGYRQRVSIGRSLGPLNFISNQNGRFGIAALRQKYEKTEEWMSYFTWAYAYSPTGDYDIRFIDYPDTRPSKGELPPEIPILTTALRIAEVVGADKFDFPAIDLSTVQAFLKANANGRLTQYTSKNEKGEEKTRELPLNFHYDLRNALAATSAVGLKAGQIAFTDAFLKSNEHQIPQDIAEATTAGPSVRGTNVRIPYVFTLTHNSITNNRGLYRVSDGTVDGIILGAVTSDTSPKTIGISNAEMSTGAAAFLNSTYKAQNLHPQLTWDHKTILRWDGVTTVEGKGEPVALNTFHNTIGAGPLSKPCGDRPIRGLNFADITADRALKEDKKIAGTNKQVLAYASINSYTGGLKAENLQILSSFPLLREAVVVDEKVVQFTKTPLARTQVDIVSPALASVPHTVVEPGAAKNTEVQMLIHNFNQAGLGGDGLYGDLLRKIGTVAGGVIANTASATGTFLAGSAINALHNWYNGSESSVVRGSATALRRPRPRVGNGVVAGRLNTVNLLQQLVAQTRTRPSRRGRPNRNRGRGGKNRGNQRRR